MLLADGFEKAFIGTGRQFNKELAVYDYDKCIEILSIDMGYEDAVEFFEYNVVGAYVGDETPIFLNREPLETHG
tara:strand:- start:1486 stop:1707 length:222 start_codon:yes stop_codon:yes gene_type:complete